MIPNMRPGVFTEYEIIPQQATAFTKAVGVIGSISSEILPLTMKICSNYEETIGHFGENGGIAPLSNTLFRNSGSSIVVVGVEGNNQAQYKQAFDLLLAEDAVCCIICDITPQDELLTYFIEKIKESSKLFFTGIPEAVDGVSYAKSINCNRICVTYPALYQPFSSVDCSPALLACGLMEGGEIAVSHQLLYGDFVETSLNYGEINRLLYYGVTVIEPIAKGYEIIRAVTTQTTAKNGSYDPTYRELDTTRKQDKVTSELSLLLKQRFSKGEITSQGALLSLIIGELSRMERQNLITSYAKPIITPQKDNPSAYLVLVSVTLSQSIQQIYLKLNINI